MLLSCCAQYVTKLAKLSSGHRAGKGHFHSNLKEKQCQRIFKQPHNCLIPHVSKVVFKILQARLQKYMNWKHPDVQAGFTKGRGTRDQIANIYWIMEKARELQRNIYFCFIDYAKAFDSVNHNRFWKILKKMGILDHLTCLLRNLYAGQEATVRTGHGTMDCFKIVIEVHQGYILSPCLFNLYAQ